MCLLPHLSHGTEAGAKPCAEGTQCLEHPTTFWIKMPFSTQLRRALRRAGFHPPDAPEPCISSWQEKFTAKHLLPLEEQVFTPVRLLKQVNFFCQNNPVTPLKFYIFFVGKFLLFFLSREGSNDNDK